MTRKKILIVDDEKVIADVIQELLTLEGYIAVTANNGVMGFEKFNEEKPDLVLTDFMMPFMNGIELIKEIRKNPENDNVPIILTSSMSKVSSFENEGWQKFIKKPTDINTIMDSIIELLKFYANK